MPALSRRGGRAPGAAAWCFGEPIAPDASTEDIDPQAVRQLRVHLARQLHRPTERACALVAAYSASNRAVELDERLSVGALDATPMAVLFELAEVRGDLAALELLERCAGLEGDR